MRFLKNSIIFPTCFFILLLALIVGVSYKRNPYLVNIQYQSLQDPETDGVEKILVSYIDGVRNCTTENFEYNEEKDRYEYVISGKENTYLNLYLNPFQTFRCNLEYRLKYEDSKVDPSDAIIITLYSGRKPVQQQDFSLFDNGTKEEYQLDLYMDTFVFLLFVSFGMNIICVLKIVPKKQIHMVIVCGIITVIWSVLWFIGMGTGALSEKAVFNRFAILLGVLLIFPISFSLIRNVISAGSHFVVDTAKRIMPSISFMVITCCIYIPSSLFLGNINEFVMPYQRISDLIFFYAIACILILFALGLCIRGEKEQYIYSLILFFLTMGFYVQSNFLNPVLSDLNGEEIDWGQFAIARMHSRVGWGSLCIVLLALIFLLFWKSVKAEKPLRYLAVLFSLMQVCSLAAMLFTCHVDSKLCRTLGKEGQFTVGEENVIVFLVDCLQADAVQDYVEGTNEAEDVLENFTLFTNAVGGGAPTEYAVPLMVTGVEYDVMQDLDDYYEEIWQEGYLLKDLQKEKYDVRMYTEAGLLKGIPFDMVQNLCETSGNKVGNKILFGQRMLQLTNFYMMPLSLKKHFWMATEDLSSCLVANDKKIADTAYQMDDVRFYEEYEQNHLQKQDGKAFRFYHLRGVHKPYRHNEHFQPAGYNETDEKRTFQGVMMLIREYMEDLKTLGVYDKSTIVILGDHGRHNSEDAEKYPAILLKRAGEDHSLQYSDNPVCFRNLVATIGSEIKSDYTEYGPGLYDVNCKSDVQRLQTLNNQTATDYAGYTGELYADFDVGARFIVDDDEMKNQIYREWNPYEINRISYTYGDMIDFTSSGSYADSLTERLYPAGNGKTASNELTICFDLPDDKTGDLEFGFTYAGLYNDTQKIRIYANGHKVENVMCTSDEIGKEVSIVIPKQYVKEKPLIVRMVFPNAVTPNQLDRSNDDTRVLSVTFDKMWLKVANS